jgi:small subunit ribosomal protein S6
MGAYEIVAVLRPDLDEEGLVAALERISQRIKEHGGTGTTVERWGKRKLAYPIKKHRDGYYALFVFTLPPDRIGPLRQTLGLHEDLLRFAFSTHRPKPTPVVAAAAPAPAASPPPPVSGPTSGATTTKPAGGGEIPRV